VLENPGAYRYLGRIAIGDIEDRYSMKQIVPKMVEMYCDALALHSSARRGAAADRFVRREHPNRVPTAVQRLAAAHPWPTERPLVESDTPEASQKTVPARYEAALRMIARHLPEEGSVVVDLAAQLGYVAYHSAGLPKGPLVIAVDNWLGKQPIAETERFVHDAPRHYDVFLKGCWERRRRIIPIRASANEALVEIEQLGIEPAVIFINATRATVVAGLLRSAHRHFRGAKIVGLRWSGHAGGAARRFLERHELELEVHDDCWCVWQERAPWQRLGTLGPSNARAPALVAATV
jgi:hypothetical protein